MHFRFEPAGQWHAKDQSIDILPVDICQEMRKPNLAGLLHEISQLPVADRQRLVVELVRQCDLSIVVSPEATGDASNSSIRVVNSLDATSVLSLAVGNINSSRGLEPMR